MSAHLYGAEMEKGEAVDYLREMGVGTLAFGSDKGGYAVPMSFGYDAPNNECVFQFGFGDGSEKQTYIETDNPVTLAVHDRESVDDWRSVLVRGSLERIPSDEHTRASAVFAAQAKMVSVDIFEREMNEMEFEWYRIDVDSITGRRGTVSEEPHHRG
ncbi:MAG: pyridoxamine 5'-phosphate oxidase family protein [Halobacteriales archaeon]